MELKDKTELMRISGQMQSVFENLQRNTLSLVLVGLFIACLILSVEIAHGHEYFWALSTALGLLIAIPLIWFTQRISLVAAYLGLVLTTFFGRLVGGVLGGRSRLGLRC